MTRHIFRLLAVLLTALTVGMVSAQDTPEFADMRALIADLPVERGPDGAFILGDPDAPLTLVEFADFACPHCQRYREVIHAFVEQYVVTGMARLEVRIFPTAGGARTQYAARVAECAGLLSPGGFWQAHETLYALAMVNRYNAPLAKVVADELGIDYLSMLGCTWRSRRDVIDSEYGYALGVSGTPAIMVRVGEGEAGFITIGNTTYDRGGPSLEVLAMVVETGYVPPVDGDIGGQGA